MNRLSEETKAEMAVIIDMHQHNEDIIFSM
jgi:hypothetical protein